uniref:Ribosomal protein mS38 C-terminal domain-containing protein n=1 Tax=Corethron hystrix TaxID=216773 RepID=A0A7S1BVS0_9STRA|mmetsp:Transcript_40541/g.95193  ORF Transcript_40541/g.95193 Transcript_40541/m.95193 type:complete len:176 (+) Transcript_40541:183-710(+)|eukprot:CAMPEP_0113308682 /NCGR_PEP_ID=MMETSP0010_2-20120614/7031_1 /TAXON_ID=216773 ORGANISM="Corethron hystrix, Strain 308" /NCGR_SAMPLE_ID=MMETSP0010_2 /ASSEMBLY_ACC=CAM_ASM_000155 /LENGTH=175 /DNA_ID=CAMNT_0000163789 /DNA_START=149 /DNA_END=676 /DNA_ORIENTATION=+ /assembly_acc=CAM_ASM_000155
MFFRASRIVELKASSNFIHQLRPQIVGCYSVLEGIASKLMLRQTKDVASPACRAYYSTIRMYTSSIDIPRSAFYDVRSDGRTGPYCVSLTSAFFRSRIMSRYSVPVIETIAPFLSAFKVYNTIKNDPTTYMLYENDDAFDTEIYASSTLKKRKAKMNKHKLKKRRKKLRNKYGNN